MLPVIVLVLWLPLYVLGSSSHLQSVGLLYSKDAIIESTHPPVDTSLYSRQLLVYGESAQIKLRDAHVLVIGNESLALEVVKNLALSGIGSLSHCCSSPLQHESQRCSVSLAGQNTSLLEYAQSINQNIQVRQFHSSMEDCLPSRNSLASANLTAIVATDLDMRTLTRLDSICREIDVPLVAVGLTGSAGFVFNDFHSNFEVTDADGEDPKEVPLAAAVVTQTTAREAPESANMSTVRLTSVAEEPHRLGLGDEINIILGNCVNHPSPIMGTITEVIETHKCGVRIPAESAVLVIEAVAAGTATVVKAKRNLLVSHGSLLVELLRPSFCAGNECLPTRLDRAQSLSLLACLKVRDQLSMMSQADTVQGEQDAESCYTHSFHRALVVEELRNMGVVDPEKPLKEKGEVGAETITAAVMQVFRVGDRARPLPVRSQCAACVSVLGAIAAQEVIKAVTHMYTPISQFLLFNGSTGISAPARSSSRTGHADSAKDARKHKVTADVTEASPYDPGVLRELRSMRVFVVGAGAIGCELLKNFALLGVGAGSVARTTKLQKENPGKAHNMRKAGSSKIKKAPHRKRGRPGRSLWASERLLEGGIIVTDMDVIERSNLNRQLLFRERDIGQLKSEVAAREVAKINPSLRGRVCGLAHRVGPETETVFDAAFWADTDLVVTALDNVDARKYVDEQCVSHGKWLLDSGTLGTKGNTQVVIPHVTESYSASADPEEDAIPLCTIKTFPTQPEHCVAWAKSRFEEYFGLQPQLVRELQAILQKEKASLEGEVETWLDALSEEQMAALQDCVFYAPWTGEQTDQWALDVFERLYSKEVLTLLAEHPADEVDEDGQAFWGRSRKLPRVQTFNPEDPTHRTFVDALASLRSVALGFRAAGGTASGHTNADRKQNPKACVLRAILADVDSWKTAAPSPQEFDKDETALGHVAVVAALANLRCRAYGIKEIDTLQVQKIAGNIIPALATTTSVVAGLVTLEVIKLAAERVKYRRYLARRKETQQHKRDAGQAATTAARRRLSLFPSFGRRLFARTTAQDDSTKPPARKHADGDDELNSHNRLAWDRQYLKKHKARLLSTFSNRFINLARPMIAAAQPQGVETFTLGGREFTAWDSIEAPKRLGVLTVADLLEYLMEEYGVVVDTVSWGDALLYADFLPDGDAVLATPLKVLLRQALVKAGQERGDGTPVSISRHLRGKRFVTLQVTAVADEGEETGNITMPPIRILI